MTRSEKSNQPSMPSSTLLAWAASGQQPLADTAFTLFEIRKLRKAYDAFIKPTNTARVYARPNPAGTKGTRFSYSDPNLQQWSKEKDSMDPRTGKKVLLAPNLRNLVVPDLGMVFVESDYSALELRLVALKANIPQWLEWMAPGSGIDMHIEHVKMIWGNDLSPADLKRRRQMVKTLTYSRFYNYKKNVSQAFQILKPQMPQLTESTLVDIYELFDTARPQIPAWHESDIAYARAHGFVELPLTGARQMHSTTRPDTNQLLSYTIQSTGGDIINPAMLRIAPRLRPFQGARVVLQVHDSLVCQARKEDAHMVASIVKEEMEWLIPTLWGHNNITFPVDQKFGHNWRDMVDEATFFKEAA